MWVGTGRQGDKETRRQGDKETRRQGDKETRRQGDKEIGTPRSHALRGNARLGRSASRCVHTRTATRSVAAVRSHAERGNEESLSLSPCLLVSLSPSLPVSPTAAPPW